MSVMNTSLSGMLGNTSWLSTIAQNVANANTVGYKTVTTNFAALVDSAVDINAQYAGVRASTTALNGLQGQNMQTNVTTDLAVQGAGFFIVQDTTGNIFLTRNGSFVPDKNGNLLNSAGYYLLGAPFSQQGVSVNSLTSLGKINIANGGDSSIPSTEATMVANLPSNATAVTSGTPAAGGSNVTAETSVVAYDNLGASHTLNIYFTKTATGTWEADVYDAATAAAGGGFPYSAGPLATQTLTFSSTDGKMLSGSPLSLTVPNGQTLNIDISQTTQLAANFAVSSAQINGNAPGSITDVSVSQDGTLSFSYGNGSVTPIYRIPLAKVAAPNNMKSVLGDAFQPNMQSGAPQVGLAGTGGLGVIDASALEQSTVDLATELTSMVQAQSSYQANAKVFQSGAKILDVLNGLQV